MHLWIVFTTFLFNPLMPVETPGVSADSPPMRYRGIEQLLAKFEAEAEAEAADPG